MNALLFQQSSLSGFSSFLGIPAVFDWVCEMIWLMNNFIRLNSTVIVISVSKLFIHHSVVFL